LRSGGEEDWDERSTKEQWGQLEPQDGWWVGDLIQRGGGERIFQSQYMCGIGGGGGKGTASKWISQLILVQEGAQCSSNGRAGSVFLHQSGGTEISRGVPSKEKGKKMNEGYGE